MRRPKLKTDSRSPIEIIRRSIEITTAILAIWLAWSKENIRIPVIILIFCLVIYISINERKKYRTNHISQKSLDLKRLKNVSQKSFKFQYVTDSADLLDISEFEHSLYGNEAFHERKLKYMLVRYPQGILYYDNPATGKVGAYLGFWPIKQEAFENLMRGVIADDGVQPDDIDSQSEYWWIGTVGVELSLQKTSTLIFMLEKLITDWTQAHQHLTRISIVTTGWSSSGRGLLKKAGFKKQLGDLNPPMYTFNGSADLFATEFGKMAKQARDHLELNS